jgi:hypothetical protein
MGKCFTGVGSRLKEVVEGVLKKGVFVKRVRNYGLR